MTARAPVPAPRREDGFVLPLALWAIVSLGILVAAVSFYVTQNVFSADRSLADQRARALADAGLNAALGVLEAAPNPLDPAAVPAGSASLENGTYSYTASLTGTTWTLTGTGTLPAPGPSTLGPITKTASLKADVVMSTSLAWNYLYTASPTGCMKLINGSSNAVSVYTTADLCVEQNSHIVGADVDVRVGGKLATSNAGSVGTSSAPVASVAPRLGCAPDPSSTYDLSQRTPHPCTQSDAVYGPIVPFVAIPKPTVDWAAAYAAGRPAAGQRCSDPDGIENGSLASASRPLDLTPPAAGYSCVVRDSGGNVTGSLIWTPSAESPYSSGTLAIAGTVFLDGSVVVQNGMHALYRGRGTIYASGGFRIVSGASLCVTTPCDTSWVNGGATTWDPSANLLVFATAGTGSTGYGIEIAGGSFAQLAAYAERDWVVQSGAADWGPVIANQITITGGSGVAIPDAMFPSGAPGIVERVQPRAASYG